MEPYYFNQLNKEEQAVYRAIKIGVTGLKPSFEVPMTEQKVYGDIFFKLRLDCPEIFYVETFKYRYYQDGSTVQMIPQYLFDKSKILQHQQALKARIEKLARPAAAMSDVEKEQYIHDFICNSVTYDKLKKAYSHEIIGPLGHGVGVCEGMAKSVKALCNELGIWCIIVISEANPEKGIKYRHAWNLLKLGKQYYHLDTTFDNTLSRESDVRYDYFNLSDEQIFRDHEPIIDRVPACSDSDCFYYKEKKLSFTKMEQVASRALQAAKKGKHLVFHWRGGALNKNLAEEILKEIEEAGKKKEKFARVRINWAQAIFHVSYEQGEQKEDITVETLEV